MTYQDLDHVSTDHHAGSGHHLEPQEDLSFTFEYSWQDENLGFHDHQEYVGGENSKSCTRLSFYVCVLTWFFSIKGQEVTTTSSSRELKKATRRKKSNYKHVPHCEKPPQIVAKRNARERRRVHAVNQAFVRLRKAIPFENKRGKRISKVRVLQKAIDYIKNLHVMVMNYDGTSQTLPQFYQQYPNKSDKNLFTF